MGEYYMAKSSLYAAHRAAGASSGRYKASLYDIANVGYAGAADVGIEQYKQEKEQETYESIGAALSLASSVVGGLESKGKHEELQKLYGVEPSKTSKDFTGNKAGFDVGDLFGDKSIFNKGKSSSVTKTTKKVPTLGSKENPYSLSETGTKAVGEAFRQAKEAGAKIGSTIWGKVDDELKSWKYEYK
tara:strand:- start:3259 stop:3819 length:561 start_codon:yes stop_codon:yes gene_type:complete